MNKKHIIGTTECTLLFPCNTLRTTMELQHILVVATLVTLEVSTKRGGGGIAVASFTAEICITMHHYLRNPGNGAKES